ncbi:MULTISPECIES: DUF1707 and DUF4190 domain-containing protein [Streptomycetaceae]|uniref:DUF1707 and DUF4190 domain-containing protein n=1 Tax=Streptomycetaceae TaxID=2062 RepID=UPI0004781B19|nr:MULTISPECIES: DUF1707 and DUF4190 domain-containing protein [Streptomycetaceae]MYX37773.1 DUF4190 domain-containing protein [Streptomyces sp. SID8377]
MRAAHDDRERTVDVLKTAFAEGRLTQPEFEDRVGLAYQAVTYQELYGLTVDIPRPRRLPTPPPAVNAKAVASVVCGAVGMFGLLIPGIPAVVLGHMARREIRRTGERGDALAVCGLVMGYLLTAFTVALTAIVVMVVVAVSHG